MFGRYIKVYSPKCAERYPVRIMNSLVDIWRTVPQKEATHHDSNIDSDATSTSSIDEGNNSSVQASCPEATVSELSSGSEPDEKDCPCRWQHSRWIRVRGWAWSRRYNKGLSGSGRPWVVCHRERFTISTKSPGEVHFETVVWQKWHLQHCE